MGKLFGLIGRNEKKAVPIKKVRSGQGAKSAIILRYKGKNVSLRELADKHKIKYITAYWRHTHGFSPAEIVAGKRA